ncbi:isoprenylcysteine carboxylmethyltransferase family protein [Rhizobium sp. CNPSo 4039]|uniref:methyltransferase family protein n=1 Tax=Rhizobium sp. CNPSo 4039 TaxID=3021409 RepID=UPI00254BA4A2|nr:isoprenylcysteine carboxylmethyltransferase family protein [Rhizobium sp. CNPSo 4039]MDK4715709.1 isoprenylcysteine carboxylmethyltransferase family protein [Rhizobium sp. CNPSo 4039]
MTVTDPEPMSRRKAISYAIGLPLALLALVFLPVGRLDWRPGWVFIVFLVVVYGIAILIMQRVNPAIFRARSRFQAGTKRWDLILVSLICLGMIAEIPVGTLDSGRMKWSVMPTSVVILGYILLAVGIALGTWAQAVNRFFEPGVRLQRERGQHVISNGPYAYVRHPGYVSAIVIFAGLALALGSWWALIPAALASGVLILRTSWEDALLQAELEGYADYAGHVRFRLLPGVW